MEETNNQINQEQISVVCSKCQKANKKIYCKSLCKTCYNLVHRNKDKQREYMKKWRTQINPNYYKEYYKNHKVKTNE